MAAFEKLSAQVKLMQASHVEVENALRQQVRELQVALRDKDRASKEEVEELQQVRTAQQLGKVPIALDM